MCTVQSDQGCVFPKILVANFVLGNTAQVCQAGASRSWVQFNSSFRGQSPGSHPGQHFYCLKNEDKKTKHWDIFEPIEGHRDCVSLLLE